MWRQCNLYPSFLRFRSVRNDIPRRRSKLCRVLDYHFLYWTAVRFSEDPCDVDVFAFSVSLTDGHICRWIRRTLKYRHIWLLTREGRETDHWIFHHTNYEHIFTTLSFPLTVVSKKLRPTHLRFVCHCFCWKLQLQCKSTETSLFTFDFQEDLLAVDQFIVIAPYFAGVKPCIAVSNFSDLQVSSLITCWWHTVPDICSCFSHTRTRHNFMGKKF